MQRYFIQLAYDGSAYAGWQIQPNALTLQEVIQNGVSKIYNQKIEVVGCGRTDAGVHASQYYCHLDLPDNKFDESLIAHKLNGVLPFDIGIKSVIKFKEKRHARFDASSRSYIYNIHFTKDPFQRHHSFRYNQSKIPDFTKLNEAARILLSYKEFFPFCKTNTEVETYLCDISSSYWHKINDYALEYHITANRFLRGMVRLIVGMCIHVAIDKISIDEVKNALDTQKKLPHAWSVPAKGLFLSSIKYPYID